MINISTYFNTKQPRSYEYQQAFSLFNLFFALCYCAHQPELYPSTLLEKYNFCFNINQKTVSWQNDLQPYFQALANSISELDVNLFEKHHLKILKETFIVQGPRMHAEMAVLEKEDSVSARHFNMAIASMYRFFGIAVADKKQIAESKLTPVSPNVQKSHPFFGHRLPAATSSNHVPVNPTAHYDSSQAVNRHYHPPLLQNATQPSDSTNDGYPFAMPPGSFTTMSVTPSGYSADTPYTLPQTYDRYSVAQFQPLAPFYAPINHLPPQTYQASDAELPPMLGEYSLVPPAVHTCGRSQQPMGGVHRFWPQGDPRQTIQYLHFTQNHSPAIGE